MAADKAREAILGRIRRAVGEPAGGDTIAREWYAIDRGYKRTANVEQAAVLEQFEDRLKDYDATVYHSPASEVGGLIARVLGERGIHRMAVPRGLPESWKAARVEFVEDAGGGVEAIDGCDGVLTGAVLGIAETGTIVLQNQGVGGQGRRALTLLPDYHLCVVEAARVVQTVPEAVEILESSGRLATTFFSGPSATADIEMTRIKGVHGPRFVDVIVVI